MGRGHTRALIIAVSSGRRDCQTSIKRRQYSIRSNGDIFTPRRTDFHRRPVVAVQRPIPHPIRGRDGDDPIAVGRLVTVEVEVEAVVARGRDHNPLHIVHRVNSILVGCTTHAWPTQAQVQHFSRVRVGRNTRNRQPGGPAHPIGNIGDKAATLADHPYRHNGRHPVNSGYPHAVIALCANRSGHMRAMPATIAGWRASVTFSTHHPIPRIMGITIPPVAIIGRRHIGDEVITTHPAPIQVRVIGDA